MGEQEIIRVDGRSDDELRGVKITPNYIRSAEGSVLIELGETKVICTATLEQRVPYHAKEANCGWLTAEYAMLPRSTAQRTPRDGVRGKVAGRSMEIQRLIGRSLRACVNLDKLVDRTLIIDCDVIQADGGTRTASVTGGYAALALAVQGLQQQGRVAKDILANQIAAISVGMVEGRPVLDLCYLEDSQAEVDLNLIMTADGRIVEIQGTAESQPFNDDQLEKMLGLAKKGIGILIEKQNELISSAEE